MSGQNNLAVATETPAASQVDVAAVKAAALKADGERRSAIKALVTGSLSTVSGLDEVVNAALDDAECTPDQASKRILAFVAKGAEPLAAFSGARVSDGADEMRKDITASLLNRAGVDKSVSASNNFKGYTLYELARASAERAGIKTSHLDKMGVVAAAFTHSTSDFGNLLADVANKSMLKGYEEAEETFQRWTTAGNLSDFKINRRVGMNTFPSLKVVPEGAEYTYATFGDRGETIQLATYGNMFSITRQAIINDDLNSFTSIPRGMGRSAIRTIGDLVYGVLTGNPNMSDGVALFHATHNNLLTAAPISTASIDAMSASFAKQRDPTGTILNVGMSYVIVPVALRGLATQVAQSEVEVGAVNKNNTTPNWVRGSFEVIADARLDASSATAWYGAANPGTYDTIEVAYLDGNQSPTLDQQAGWDVDGVVFKVRMDAGVKALDFRTLAKNNGV